MNDTTTVDYWHYRCVTSEWGFLRVDTREVPAGTLCATCGKPIQPNPLVRSSVQYALIDR